MARAARFRLAMGNAATREERRERREPSAPAHSCSALMLGLDNAGKSAVLARLCGEEVRTLLPTRGFWIRSLTLANRTELSVWDVGGRRDVRGYWRAYYSKVQSLIFVIDAGDRRRMQEASDVLMQLLDEEALVGMPLLVLANKQDLAGALPAGEIEACMHLGSILDRPWHCIGCSALRGSGLAAGLKWLSSVVTNRSPTVSRRTWRRERAPASDVQ